MEKDIKDSNRKFGLVEFMSEQGDLGLDTHDSLWLKTKYSFCQPQREAVL